MKQRLLLVDDIDGSILSSLGNSIIAETYEIVAANREGQPLANARAGGIDLVLMNIDSRSRPGWDAIYDVTSDNPQLPVIVITRRAGLAQLAEASGARALVERPVDVAALMQTIREVLGGPVETGERRRATVQFTHVPADSIAFREMLHRRETTPYSVPEASTRHWGINE